MMAQGEGHRPPSLNRTDLAWAASAQPPADWEDLLAADPAADFYHRRIWTELAIRQFPDAEPVWVTARLAGDLVGGLAAVRRRRLRRLGPVRWWADRLESHLEGTSGGPLVHSGLAPELQENLFRWLVQEYRAQRGPEPAACHLILNPEQERRFGRVLRRRSGWRCRPLTTAAICLAGGAETVARERMAKNKRNERNRGLRAGAEVFATTDSGCLEAYYPLYREACRHWGRPPAALDVLQALLADPAEAVFFTCVRLGDRVIGGHLNLCHGSRVLTCYGVTDPAVARTHFPSTLAIWGDIVEACRRGAGWLDLGGSGGIGSLETFKRSFGAEDQARGWYVHTTPLLGLLQRARQGYRRCRRDRPGQPQRWHDGFSMSASGNPAPEGRGHETGG